MLTLKANPKLPGDWKAAHNAAVEGPLHGPSVRNHPARAMELTLIAMLRGWAVYADAHKELYDSPIGEDGVLGEHWRDIGLGLRGLLNGELGRLDGGTLDAFILDTLRAEGAETEGL